MSKSGANNIATTIDASVNDILNFEILEQQLNSASGSSSEKLITPEVIKLLKDTVTTIDDGLKSLYQTDSDVNTIVYGRASLIDQLIDVI
jgi:hypothetical protein